MLPANSPNKYSTLYVFRTPLNQKKKKKKKKQPDKTISIHFKTRAIPFPESRFPASIEAKLDREKREREREREREYDLDIAITVIVGQRGRDGR